MRKRIRTICYRQMNKKKKIRHKYNKIGILSLK